jgi:hypothetical protein
MAAEHVSEVLPRRVRCAIALRVEEQTCEVWSEGARASIGFAPQFPTPRTQRVSPGHLLAVATAPDGRDLAVWRWYDAVVLGHDEAGHVRLWEPGHGEVVAEARPTYELQQPGSRVYASAGLPGADWWVASQVLVSPDDADVELDAVDALYADNGLWPATLGPSE